MSTKALKVSGKGTLVRPQYFPGLLLEDEDLNAAVKYTRATIRLLMRSLFGCGVVCGLKVTAEYECNGRRVKVTVSPGVAFDCLGNTIEVRDEHILQFDPECAVMPPALWVVLCHQETSCHSVSVSCCDEDTDRVVQRRVSEGYQIHVYDSKPESICGCGQSTKTGAATNGKRSCCPEHGAATQGERSDTSIDPCDCYRAHAEGECACGGCCDCVLLGHFTLSGNEEPKPNDAAVRFVRPMLVGAMDCYEQFRKPGSSEQPRSVPRATTDWLRASTIEELRWHLQSAEEQVSQAQFELRKDAIKQKQLAAALEDAGKKDLQEPSNKQAFEAAQGEADEHKQVMDARAKTRTQMEKAIVAGRKILEQRELQKKIDSEEEQLAYVEREILIAESGNLGRAVLEPLENERKRIVKNLKDLRGT